MERPFESQTPEDMNAAFDALIKKQEEAAEKEVEEKKINEEGFGIEDEE